MRFLLEFVACCGSPTQQQQRAAEPSASDAKDGRWLVPATAISAAPIRRYCRKKQRVGATDWKPSLGSISEDSVVPLKQSPSDVTVSSTGREPKRRSSAAGTVAVKVRLRSYSDRHSGSVAMPTIMPTFSPTPFMF